jgi:hypothetical protein
MSKLENKTNWQILARKTRNGKDTYYVTNSVDFCDYPIQYELGGIIAYDFPGLIPETVKAKVQKLFAKLHHKNQII